VNNLEKALNTLFEDTWLVSFLAAVLARATNTGRISYGEIKEIAGNHTGEVLLLGSQWRLLLPTRSEKSSAREDRLLQCQPGESYEVPNIIRNLVQSASKIRFWTPMKNVAEVFKEIEEPAWQKIAEMVEKLGKVAINGQISAAEIRQTCASMGVAEKVSHRRL